MKGTEAPTRAKPSSAVWAVAATFGTLWGAFEVTLGTFLHTLKVPFVGVLMASIGAAILVAARHMGAGRGSALATAVVAAMLKGFSPAGAILGPMVAIIASGVLVEIALAPWPRSIIGAYLSGMLVVAWSLVQPFVTQTLFYGTQILDLYREGVVRLGRILGLGDSAGWWVVLTVAALACLFGGLVACYGRRAGRLVAAR